MPSDKFPYIYLRDLAFGLTGLLAIAMIAATVVEKFAGSGVASALIYRSPWMIALWTVTAATCAVYIIRRRSSLTPVALLLHAALIVILSGAAVTFFTGQQGKLTLREGADPIARFTLDNGEEALLPFSIALDKAAPEYYPGTSAAMDYVSRVTLFPGGEASISMNRILDRDGYRFYQTAIGDGYSVLTVSHDPWGIGFSYAGYALLIIAIVAFPFSRRTRFRALMRKLRRARKVAIAAAILITCGLTAAADEATPMPPVLPKALARNFGKINVYWGDRVMPLQTMARDFCLKVYGNETYRGLTPEQVLTGWLFYYDQWKNEPFIKTEGSARRMIGAIGSHASLKEFYDRSGYRLEQAVASDLADAKLRQTDSRVAMVTMVCTGAAFKVFPLPEEGQADVRWLSLADRPPADLDADSYIFISGLLDTLSREICARQWKNADDQLTLLLKFQADADHRMTAETGRPLLPDQTRIAAERLYNQVGTPLLPAIIALITGFAGIIGLRLRRLTLAVSLLTLLWCIFLLTLRGLTGGYIPLSNGYETMLAMGVLALLFTPLAPSPSLLVAGLALMVAYIGRGGATVSLLMPVLSSPLLSVHVLLVMASYSLFAILAIISARSLITADSKAAALCAMLLYPAVFLLAAGIFVGAIWANQSWGRYWGWDPKETWALITLLIYAFPLHCGSFAAFRRPRVIYLYLLFAFLSVLMTYFGVNYLLSGLHSYA